METLLQMLLPSAVLPFLLSALLWWSTRRKPAMLWSLALIWLPSYVWLLGWPPLFPAEANQWLWLLVLAAVTINLMFKSRLALMVAFQTALLALILAAVAWPVLQYQLDMLLMVELVTVMGVGFLLSNAAIRGRTAMPVLSLAISSGGMGIISALGGSLLMGQLAGALASVLLVFAVAELFGKLQSSFSPVNLVPVTQLYLVILVIARVFAEIPLGPSLLLLVSPVAILIPANRYAPLFSAVSVLAAMGWLLLTADSSGYY